MDDERQHALAELAALTRDYARYSRSAGGLAAVLGGVCCLAAYLLGGLLPPTPALRVALLCLPLLWLTATLGMARHYYQRFGRVEEQEGAAERRTHRWCVAVALGVAALLTATAWSRGGPRSAGEYGYLALAWLLALAVWRWLRHPLEAVVGAFLFCQAALLCLGRSYPVIGSAAAQGALPMALLALLFPLAALLLIARGVADHRRFRHLREQLQRLRDASVGAA